MTTDPPGRLAERPDAPLCQGEADTVLDRVRALR